MAAVDEFDLAEASPDGGARPERSGHRGRAHPWGWMLAALALIGVGSANAEAIPAMVGHGGGAEVGLLDLDISQAPEVVWESPPLSSANLVTIEGTVAVAVEYNYRVRAVGLDLATGAERWSHTVPDGTCQWSDQGMCVENPATPEAAIVTIDIEDGTRVAQPYPGAVGAASVPGGRVVIEATGNEAEELVLIEDDGTERWRVTADAAQVSDEGVWVDLAVTEASLILPMSSSEIDLETGATAISSRWWFSEDLWIEATDSGDYVVTTADGSFTLAPEESWLSWDDDFGGPIALRHDGMGLIADRRADREQLWRIETSECYWNARLLGSVILQCWDADSYRLHTVDQLTGETRWELSRAVVIGASRDLLLVADQHNHTLLAVEPRAGDIRWSLPIASAASGAVTEVPGGILIAADSAVVRLAWD
ncbi:PQQ-binding-like beta-propeller repeat protein [Pseudactinotalea sp.]|uniref:outer membrane protein assembly factor BamB family protein n=1 Tax=Pseudactinotalea sp. TaxID=1926260 RepID=UPI003B3B306A